MDEYRGENRIVLRGQAAQGPAPSLPGGRTARDGLLFRASALDAWTGPAGAPAI